MDALLRALDSPFARYLAHKKAVDDRALNTAVWQKLERGLAGQSSAQPPRIFEIGGGIGTMLARLVERGALRYARYALLDTLEENVRCAPVYLAHWAGERDLRWTWKESAGSLEGQGLSIEMQIEQGDLFALPRAVREQGWDLVIAHAFLDVVDPQAACAVLLSLLRRGGLFYFSLTFDGLTAFEPPFDPPFENLLLQRYHRSMDQRVVNGRPSGDSRAGRHLFSILADLGGRIQEAGPSDWVVFPRAGQYRPGEAPFLRHIVDTVYRQMALDGDIPPERLKAWRAARLAQVERGQLVYIAHQLDVVGSKP